MLVKVHTDNHIHGSAELSDRVSNEVEATFSRFGERITRVEVYLNDTNGPKGGANDKRCLMEARVAGHPLLAASHEADSLDEAITSAAEKLEREIDRMLHRLHDPKGQTSFSGE